MRIFLFSILTALQFGIIFSADADGTADRVSAANTDHLFHPVEHQVSFGDGLDNYNALSYSSRASSSDSLSGMVAHGLNYSFTQRAGESFLHFSLTDNSNGTHKLAGGAFGKLKLSFLHGDGDGLSRHRPGISGLTSNFFHGSASRSYRYNGTALGWSWTDELSSHAGTVSIDAPGVDSRSVHFAGATIGSLSATLYQIERAKPVGQGLSAAWHGRSFSVGYELLKSDYRASWREISLAYRGSRGGAVRLSFSSGKNDLYTDAAENRVGLSYRLGFGGGKRSSSKLGLGGNFAAARAATNFDDLTRQGLGAVGVGLVVRSSDTVLDQTPRYAQQPQAAFAILSLVNPISVKNNVEHGGSIYRNPDGSFSPSQLVVVGSPDSVAFNPHLLVPKGSRASAAWHTHGATTPGFVNEFFSPPDINFFNFYQVDGYLGTPMGRMFEYVRLEQTVYQYVGPNNNELILPH